LLKNFQAKLGQLNAIFLQRVEFLTFQLFNAKIIDDASQFSDLITEIRNDNQFVLLTIQRLITVVVQPDDP